jgi:hypothetical protein
VELCVTAKLNPLPLPPLEDPGVVAKIPTVGAKAGTLHSLRLPAAFSVEAFGLAPDTITSRTANSRRPLRTECPITK